MPRWFLSFALMSELMPSRVLLVLGIKLFTFIPTKSQQNKSDIRALFNYVIKQQFLKAVAKNYVVTESQNKQ